MTIALCVALAALVALVAYRLVKLPSLLPKPINSLAQPLLGDPVVEGTANAPADVPWVLSLTAQTQTRNLPGGSPPRTAADWYDPTVEAVPQTFNEHGFITSPRPAPVDPRTGLVPITNAQVCAMFMHLAPAGSICPRCGVQL